MSAHTERITSQFPANLAAALALNNDRTFAAAVLLSIVPLWLGQHIPMVDMAQHAAQVTAMREMWAGNSTFTALFEFNWFTPCLLGYMLLYVVSLTVPIAVATQIVVSLAVGSVPWLTRALLREAGADERWKWLAIPGSFGFAFYWGFFSFMVATPVALLFLIHAIRFARAPTLRTAPLVAAFSIFLFFCHVIALCYASLAALAYVAGLHRHNLRQLALRMLPFAAPLPLMVAWVVIAYTTQAAAKAPMSFSGGPLDRLYLLMLQPSGLDVFFPFFTVPAMAAVTLLPALCGSNFSRRAERWLPFAAAFVAFMAIPGYVLGVGYLYHPFGIFLTPLWLLAWDAPQRRMLLPERGQLMQLFALPVVIVFIGINLVRFGSFARESAPFDAVMASAEPNRRIASLVYRDASRWFGPPMYLRYAAWYASTQRGIVDFTFANYYWEPVRYRHEAGARITESVGWEPRDFRWKDHGGDRYDYFVVKSISDMSAELFQQKRAAISLIAHQGEWWLYRNNER